MMCLWYVASLASTITSSLNKCSTDTSGQGYSRGRGSYQNRQSHQVDASFHRGSSEGEDGRGREQIEKCFNLGRDVLHALAQSIGTGL